MSSIVERTWYSSQQEWRSRWHEHGPKAWLGCHRWQHQRVQYRREQSSWLKFNWFRWVGIFDRLRFMKFDVREWIFFLALHHSENIAGCEFGILSWNIGKQHAWKAFVELDQPKCKICRTCSLAVWLARRITNKNLPCLVVVRTSYSYVLRRCDTWQEPLGRDFESVVWNKDEESRRRRQWFANHKNRTTWRSGTTSNCFHCWVRFWIPEWRQGIP